jgi:hypothetical protein
MVNAIRAFCSTSRIVVPDFAMFWIASNVRSTITGASPIEGSSRSTSQRHYLLLAPDSVPANCVRPSSIDWYRILSWREE